MTTTHRIESFTIPKGARVVAMNPDIAEKIRVCVKREQTTIEAFVAQTIRAYLMRPKVGNENVVRNKTQEVVAAGRGKGVDRIGAFEQPIESIVVVVMPTIVALLQIAAAERRNTLGWCEEFATAITLATLSDYERVVLQAQREVDAYRLGDGPMTASVLAADLGVEWIQSPQPTRLEFNRDHFAPFQEWGPDGRVLLPGESHPQQFVVGRVQMVFGKKRHQRPRHC